MDHSSLSGRVPWLARLGSSANGRVHQLLCAADLLVLPSRYDGWGAVVNEALTVGTPVVVSNACGAQDLVTGDLQGAVFASGSVDALRAALRQRLEVGLVSSDRRAQLQAWATHAISPPAMATYLLAVLEAVQSGRAATLVPPWRTPHAMSV